MTVKLDYMALFKKKRKEKKRKTQSFIKRLNMKL